MSEPILTVLKFFLLALVWLFFIRVMRVQWVDIRTRQVATPQVPASVPSRPRRRAGSGAAQAGSAAAGAAVPTSTAGIAEGAAPPRTGPGATGTGAGFVLRAVEGPDHPARAFPVSGELTVGRSGGADIALAGDSFASSRHARIWAESGSLWIEDLGSTNGTTVNGRAVSARTQIGPGDRVQIGRTILEVGVA